jgi:glycosyltransferase involved in cell wall biosynthesis
VKYLTEFGWYPTVIACDFQRLSYFEIFENVHRIKSFIPFTYPYNLNQYGWIIPLYKYCSKLLKNIAFDILYISCPPFFPAISAIFLKNSFSIPLIIDFRDAWSLDPYKKSDFPNKLFHKFMIPRFEDFLIDKADSIIFNCPSAVDSYKTIYPKVSEKIYLIPNGYDEIDFIEYYPGNSKNGYLTFFYSGNFEVSGRNPQKLLSVIRNLIDQKYKIAIEILGNYGKTMEQLVKNFNLENHVTLGGIVSHHKAIQSMAKSDALILYQAHSGCKISAVAGKTYEYLRAGKPILAISPEGDNLDLIRNYAAYFQAADPTDAKSIEVAIKKFYTDWENNFFKSFMPPPKSYFEKFDRKALTGQLVKIFEHFVY